MKKPIEIINAKKEHISNIKNKIDNLKMIIPYINKIEAITNWELEAFSNLPKESDEIPTNDLVENLEIEYDHLLLSLPLQPDYDPTLLGGTISSTTSSSSVAFEYVARVGDLGTPDAVNYSSAYKISYGELQTSQNRVEEVRSFISKFNTPSLSTRFENCLESILQFHITTMEKRETPANFIRNLINGVKGQLFEIARKVLRENMTWVEMSKRLANSPISESVLVHQEIRFTKLLCHTTDVLKDRDLGSQTNIDDIWTQTLDLLYILSISIDLN